MSTVAAARVDVKIGLFGEGNAAKVVSDVRGGLDKLDAGAVKAGGSAKALSSNLVEFAKTGRETSGKAGAAFAGLGAVLGAAAPEVAKIGQSFTAAAGAANLIPGPIGLAAAAIAAAAIGAYELNKSMNETEAKVRNLGDASTRGLAKNLDLSVDAAIALQQALEDVPAKLRPTEALLDVVRRRAESMGKDGAEAVDKFAQALAKGPDALKEFEKQFGRLSTATASLPDVAERLGLSTAALGIATAVGAEADKAKTAAQQTVTLERERQGLLTAAADLEKQAADSSYRKAAQLNDQADSLKRQAGLFGDLVRESTAEANALQRVVDLQQEAERAAKNRGLIAGVISADIAVVEAQAGVLLGQKAQLQQNIYANQLRTAEVTRKTTELEAAHQKGLLTEIDYRTQLAGLQAEGLNADAKLIALGKQATADLKARREKGQQIHDAELAAKLRLIKVDAELADRSINTAGKVHGLKLKQLDLEEQAELTKSQRTVTTKAGHEADKLAIHREFALKRLAVSTTEQETEAKLADESLQLIQRDSQRTVELASKTAELVAAGAAKRSGSLAAVLRAGGNDERADLEERRQAWVDYQAESARVTAELTAQRDLTVEGSQDRANAETQILETQAQAYEAYAEKLTAVDEKRNQRLKDSVAMALDSIRAPAELMANAGGPGAKLGKALQATAEGVQRVSKNWKGMGQSAPDAISAVGAVAAAFIDGEREKAAILAVTEAAAAIASLVTENYVAAAGHGAAAVLYGSVAAGVVGGGGGAPSAGSGGGAGGGAAAAGGDNAASGGKGQVINVYFGKGFVVGTPQQVGVAVQGAIGSLKGSGMKAKGV